MKRKRVTNWATIDFEETIPAEEYWARAENQGKPSRTNTLLSTGIHERHKLTSQRAPELAGRCLQNRYLVHSLIGEGAYGRVFRAEQISLHRDVAVKIIGPLLDEEAELVAVFHDEAFAVSRIGHPNVVAIYDYGHTEDGLLYIAMEYVHGRTLAQIITREGPLASARTINLILQVLGALEEAHNVGVIHADLKSDNVMVQDLRGAGELVKVIDFGIARLVGEAISRRDRWKPHTREGLRIAGTPQFMAPEVISGQPPSTKADIYAVGVMMYQMLTGSLPFTGGNSLEIMMQHLQEPVPQLRMHPGHLSIEPGLEAIILRAMAKDPGERFADVSSLRSELLSIKTADCTRLALSTTEGNDHAAQCLSDKCSSNRWVCTTHKRDEPGQEKVRLPLFGNAHKAPGSESPAPANDIIELWRKALQLSIRLNDPIMLIEACMKLADELVRCGDNSAAIGELKKTAALLSSHKPLPENLWQVHLRLAKLHEQRAEVLECHFWAHSASELARDAGSDRGQKEAGELIAKLSTGTAQP